MISLVLKKVVDACDLRPVRNRLFLLFSAHRVRRKEESICPQLNFFCNRLFFFLRTIKPTAQALPTRRLADDASIEVDPRSNMLCSGVTIALHPDELGVLTITKVLRESYIERISLH